METNLSNLNELFHLEEQDIRSYSPLTLAYIVQVNSYQMIT